jgi:phage-related baseplate assembly protein
MAISTDKFDGVNLARLPAPQVVDVLDFDTVRDALLADVVALMPAFSALTPADPAVKLLELFAYRELLLRVSVNEASLANMLAFASGSDLDQIAVRYNLERWVIDPGNQALGSAAVLENDDDFRARIVRSPEGWSVAGPVGAYTVLATQASSDVRFSSCLSPAPCDILVTVQSRLGNGSAPAPLLAAVTAYLSDENRRPVGDRLTVQSAVIKPSAVVADYLTFSGPDAALVEASMRARFAAFVSDNERLGRDVTADGLHAVLRAEGVSRVTLVGWNDVICDETQAWHCTGLMLNHVGVGQ